MSPLRPSSPCTWRNPVTNKGCGELAPAGTGGRCATHKRKAWVKRTSSPPLGWAWTEMRAQVLREEPSCRRCGGESVTVDHIRSRRDGGANARENLQALCNACHDAKTQAEAARGRARAGR